MQLDLAFTPFSAHLMHTKIAFRPIFKSSTTQLYRKKKLNGI